MFGREKLNRKEGEAVAQCWTASTDDNMAFAVINDGIYASDFSDGEIRMTLLRSAGYSASAFSLGEPYHEPMFMHRMEQGEREYAFKIVAGDADEVMSGIDRQAAAFNMKPYALPFCPSGQGEKVPPALVIDKSNVTLSALKRSERDADKYIVRVYETGGADTEYSIESPIFNVSFSGKLAAFEIKTFEISEGSFKEITLLEE